MLAVILPCLSEFCHRFGVIVAVFYVSRIAWVDAQDWSLLDHPRLFVLVCSMCGSPTVIVSCIVYLLLLL